MHLGCHLVTVTLRAEIKVNADIEKIMIEICQTRGPENLVNIGTNYNNSQALDENRQKLVRHFLPIQWLRVVAIGYGTENCRLDFSHLALPHEQLHGHTCIIVH